MIKNKTFKEEKMYKQISYLEPNLQDLEHKIDMIYEKTEKLRKGSHARDNELLKMLMEFKVEFEAWKLTFCRGNNNE